MNERIKELADQCWNNFYIGDYEVKTPDIFAKKFAELLIKECISIPYAMWDKAELNADVAVKIEHRIKEHFGVES